MVANFSNVPLPTLNVGFPRGGQWHVRFNSGAAVYDPSFKNGDSFDTVANPGGKDGLNFNANPARCLFVSAIVQDRTRFAIKNWLPN